MPGGPAGDDGRSLHDPAMSTPQAQAVELMCRCDEIPDEGVELQILKGILTAATSGTFTIHGQVGGLPARVWSVWVGGGWGHDGILGC